MLYLFDLDDTIISGYMNAADKNYNVWELLPGRREIIDKIADQSGNWIGIVTNQAGVAHRHITESDVRYKLNQVATVLGFDGVTIYDGGVEHRTGAGELPVWVCYDDKRAKDTRYHLGAGRRKPSGAMIREAIDEWVAPSSRGVLFVGDRLEDEAAAKDADVPFAWAENFFSNPA